MSKVSVLMGVYQEKEEYLRMAVDSVLSQTLTDLECIIYLDGEQPKLRRILEEVQRTDKRVHILGEKENHGLGYALNRCMEAASGEYLARMDSDDISEPDRLLRQVSFLEAHSEYAFAGCATLLFDERGVYGARRMKEKPEKEDFFAYLPFIHPSVVFRREVFHDTVRYPEGAKALRCEDLALFMELYAKGYRGYNLVDVLYRYREDQNAFAKKKYRYRLTESRVRREGYDELKLFGAKSWLYTVKPLAVGLIPPPLMQVIKRQAVAKDIGYENTYGNV